MGGGLVNMQEIMPFIRECGGESWGRLRRLVGKDVAFKLAHGDRVFVMTALRVEHGYTLQVVGDVFGLTRERVRQLTPRAGRKYSGEGVDLESIREEVKRRAVMDKGAWNVHGRISPGWIREHFGREVADGIGDLHRDMTKLEMILCYRLDLGTREERLAWLHEQYYGKDLGYEEIARTLSRLGVPISTMAVCRNAKAMGFSGFSIGKRFE